MGDKFREKDSLRVHFGNKANSASKADTDRAAEYQRAAYMYFHSCFDAQNETITKILSSIKDSQELKSKAAAALKKTIKTTAKLSDIEREMQLEDQAIRQEELQDIFAGALFVLLNSLLWSMIERVKKHGGGKEPDSAGRLIGTTSLFVLIRAAGNNFRHFDQWQTTSNANQKNIQAFEGANFSPPWDRNLCCDILTKIGWDDQEKLSLEIRKLASEIFQYQTGIMM